MGSSRIRGIGAYPFLAAAAVISAMLSAPVIAGLYIPADNYGTISDSAVSEGAASVDNVSSADAYDADASGIAASSSAGSDATAYSADDSGSETSDSDGSLTVSVYDIASERVLLLPLEDYITGVVAAEMPVSFGAEALKAQAVAARSYAVYVIGQNTIRDSHHGAQLCTDSSHCKAYISYESASEKWGAEYADSVFAAVGSAVDATKGEILTYNGEAALAVFHSSSRGTTESAEDVWGGAVPYLVSVDTSEETEPQVTVFTLTELREKLAAAGIAYDGTQPPEIIYNETGRAETVRFGGETLTGTETRGALGLRSTAFKLIVLDGEYIFTVYGYGHGVGMSQYGAAEMAKNGSGYRDILAHYYPGTAISRLGAR